VTRRGDVRLWHGGVPGLKPGDRIEPVDRTGTTAHLVDGCPTCEARKAGVQLSDDTARTDRIYVTTDREYARLYAAGWPRGALYTVQVDGGMGPTGRDDPAPSWAAPNAVVLAVYDPLVTLTAGQIRRLLRRVSA
jgi:hypothetical protein